MTDPLIEENLNKYVPSWGGTFQFLPFASIAEILENGISGFSITKKKLEFKTQFDARDMAWNHMDFTHRPWIHHHYTEGLRTVLGKDISLGFTPWPRTPFLIPTFDIRVSDREFLHGYNIAGLAYVFVKISIVPQGNGDNTWSLEWFVLTKRYLRFLHGFIHRSMKKMNKKLFEEDRPIKDQRKKLRLRGYSFVNDELDFYSSTVLFPNNVRRPPAPDVSIQISSVAVGEKTVVKSAEREFLVLRKENNKILIWDNICPHQGANLSDGTICENFITCAWHGLRFAGTELNEKKFSRESAAFRATLKNGILTIFPKI